MADKKEGKYVTTFKDDLNDVQKAKAIIEYDKHLFAQPDTIVYLTPDKTGRTLRGTFSGKKFKLEQFDSGIWYPSGDKKSWEPKIREAYEKAVPAPTFGQKIKNWVDSVFKNLTNVKQQGGSIEQEQLQQEFIQFLIQDAIQQGVELQTEEDLQNYIMQLGEEGLKIKQQEFLTTKQIKHAKYGTKLEYIKKLKGQCPEGEELVYFKRGGKVCSVCQKIITNKCGGKTKKKRK